jgi:hypothetical protein
MRRGFTYRHPKTQFRPGDRSSFECNGYDVVFGHQRDGARTIHFARATVDGEDLMIRETNFRICLAKIRAQLALLPTGDFVDRTI